MSYAYDKEDSGHRRAGNASVMTILAAVFALMCAVSPANAAIIEPTPNDIGDFEHQRLYAWEISSSDWTLPAGETIDSISLNISDIYDWTNERDDLYIHLMNSIPSGGNGGTNGIFWWYDWQGGGDNWDGWGPMIGHYQDRIPGNSTENLTYDFSPALIATFTDYLLDDGTVYIGFDPDCHYYNGGVNLQLTTSAVPEPSTLLLLGGGLLGLAGLARRRKT